MKLAFSYFRFSTPEQAEGDLNVGRQNFAPRLRVGDHVVYMTVKGDGSGKSQWRLTVILHVDHLRADHATAAAEWYRQRGLALPGNCMVPGNGPLPLSMSHRRHSCPCGGGCGMRKEWDRCYAWRARKWPRIVGCRPLYIELSWDAPIVTACDLEHAFGKVSKVSATRTPPALPIQQLQRLTRRLAITLPQDIAG